MRGWVTIYLKLKWFRVRFSNRVTIKLSKKIWCLRHYISQFGSQQEMWDFGENSGAGSLQTRLWYVIADRRSCKRVIHHIYGHVTNVRFNQNSAAMAASNFFPLFYPCYAALKSTYSANFQFALNHLFFLELISSHHISFF